MYWLQPHRNNGDLSSGSLIDAPSELFLMGSQTLTHHISRQPAQTSDAFLSGFLKPEFLYSTPLNHFIPAASVLICLHSGPVSLLLLPCLAHQHLCVCQTSPNPRAALLSLF